MTCHCPTGSTKISTRKKHGKPKRKPVGRGWACMSNTPKRGTNFRPFVAAVGCSKR